MGNKVFTPADVDALWAEVCRLEEVSSSTPAFIAGLESKAKYENGHIVGRKAIQEWAEEDNRLWAIATETPEYKAFVAANTAYQQAYSAVYPP